MRIPRIVLPVIIRLNYIIDSNIQGEIIMTDNEKTTGVPIDDDALDKVAGGTDPNLKICDNTYQPGVLNYATQPTEGSNKPGVSIKTKNDRLNIPINQTHPDITETSPKTSGRDLEYFDEELAGNSMIKRMK